MVLVTYLNEKKFWYVICTKLLDTHWKNTSGRKWRQCSIYFCNFNAL